MDRKGIRQVDLARRTRIDSSRINRYVTGCCFPSAKTIARLARALGCKSADIREGTNNGGAQ